MKVTLKKLPKEKKIRKKTKKYKSKTIKRKTSKKRTTQKKKKSNRKSKHTKQKNYYLIKSNYLNPLKLETIFNKRGNWIKYNEQKPQKENPDLLYIDEKYMYDRKIWKYKPKLKSVVDLSSDNYSISNKRNLYNHLVNNSKSEDNIKSYLMNQLELNIYNIFKNQDSIHNYKTLFARGKIWILKPVYGMGGGRNIKIIEDFSQFKNTINKIIYKNKNKWIYLNYNNYKKKRDLEKFEFNIEWVFQEYITNPLLIEEKKFHLRIFYLYDASNKKCYILDKAKVLTAKDKYKKKDYYNKDIHDTHFKSTSKTYYFPDYFNEFIDDYTINSIMDQIKTIFKEVSKVITAKCYKESKHCFHIFGGDIMITDNYKAKLIEINEKPSFKMYVGEKEDYTHYYFENLMETIVDKHFHPIKEIKKLNNFIDVTKF